MRLQLSPHVSACIAAGRFVFLDLMKDQYFCLDRTGTAALTAVLLPDRRFVDTPATSVQPEKLIESLVRRGVLTRGRAAGRRVLSAEDAMPRGVLIPDDWTTPLQAVDVWSFVVASTRAAAALKWRTIQGVVGAVERRMRRGRAAGAPGDLDLVRRRVAAFNMLRPLFPMNYLCLFDSLALLNFLAADALYPTWIFGVRTDPFHAHCWVQAGDLVCNDEVEHVRSYTPILMI